MKLRLETSFTWYPRYVEPSPPAGVPLSQLSNDTRTRFTPTRIAGEIYYTGSAERRAGSAVISRLAAEPFFSGPWEDPARDS